MTKGIISILILAAIIWFFWMSWEFVVNRRKNNNLNKFNNKENEN